MMSPTQRPPKPIVASHGGLRQYEVIRARGCPRSFGEHTRCAAALVGWL